MINDPLRFEARYVIPESLLKLHLRRYRLFISNSLSSLFPLHRSTWLPFLSLALSFSLYLSVCPYPVDKFAFFQLVFSDEIFNVSSALRRVSFPRILKKSIADKLTSTGTLLQLTKKKRKQEKEKENSRFARRRKYCLWFLDKNRMH